MYDRQSVRRSGTRNNIGKPQDNKKLCRSNRRMGHKFLGWIHAGRGWGGDAALHPEECHSTVSAVLLCSLLMLLRATADSPKWNCRRLLYLVVVYQTRTNKLLTQKFGNA